MDAAIPRFTDHTMRFYEQRYDWCVLNKHIHRRYSMQAKTGNVGGMSELGVSVLRARATAALAMQMRLLRWRQTMENHVWGGVSNGKRRSGTEDVPVPVPVPPL